MPTIDELTNKTKKKFIKSEYRPWNYMEQIDKESIENQLEIKQESTDDRLDIIESSETLKLANDMPPSQSYADREDVAIQIVSDIETTLDVICRLTGHQKKIFVFIVERCMSRGLLVSGVINGEALIDLTGTTIKMIKTSIQRLVGKGLIIREKGKTGRGGFYLFRITELVRNALIEYKRMVGIGNQLEIKQESIGARATLVDMIDVSKRSVDFPAEWEEINITPLENIGFNKGHLRDIYEPNLCEPNMVQESIMHFAYGIEFESSKYKHYDDLLNVFVGRLRKGKPWYETNYRSPQEIAQQQMIEMKQGELNRRRKLEDELFKIAFLEWQDSLNVEDKEKIVPNIKKKGDLEPLTSKLSRYFKENVWPDKKSSYLVTNDTQ